MAGQSHCCCCPRADSFFNYLLMCYTLSTQPSDSIVTYSYSPLSQGFMLLRWAVDKPTAACAPLLRPQSQQLLYLVYYDADDCSRPPGCAPVTVGRRRGGGEGIKKRTEAVQGGGGVGYYPPVSIIFFTLSPRSPQSKDRQLGCWARSPSLTYALTQA